jgi:hypothetical protein
MAELKTQPNRRSVSDFLKTVDDPLRRKDCRTVAALMRRATGNRATLWGENIVGFGRYHYKHANGNPASWFLTGFSPRKRELTIYIMPGFSSYGALMKRLGKYRTGKSCLYLKRLADIDEETLAVLIERSVRDMAAKHG